MNSETVNKKLMRECTSERQKLVFSDLSVDYETIRLSSFYHHVITLRDLPEETVASLMARFYLPFHFYMSANIYVPSFSKELNSLKQKRKLSHSLAINGTRPTDLDSEAKLSDTEEVLREIISSNQKIFLASLTLVLRDENLKSLRDKTRQALQRLRGMGIEGLKEDVAAYKVFKSVIPATCEKTPRLKRMKTDTMADLLPVYQKSSGNKKAVCLFRTQENGLFKFNLFDEGQSVWNFLISGTSGSGKSFLVNNLILQFLKEYNENGEAPVIRILDVGGSYKKITELLGGQYYEINLDSEQSLNPFELLPHEKTPSPEKISSLKAILEIILKEEDKSSLPKLKRSLIEEEIVKIYESTQDRYPTFSDLRNRWQESTDPILQEFASILYPWTKGSYGKLLNAGKTNLVLEKREKGACDIATFDLKGLTSKKELQAVMILVLTDLIWRDIQSNPQRAKLVILDECWQLLQSAAFFIEECYRTFRKYGASIGAISQAIEDFKDSPIATAILNNAPTRFILSQKGDLNVLKEVLKLNDREVEAISGLRQIKGEFSEFFLAQDGHHKDKKLEQDYRKKYPELSTQELFYKLATDFPKGNME